MAGKAKYDQLFVDTFLIDESQLDHNLTYQSVPAWDSVGHMSLMAGLEDEFGIELDADDIVDFESYEKGILILEKYGVAIGKQEMN